MHTEKIIEELKNKISRQIISRKIFISYPTKVFVGNEDVEFQIKNEISEFFNIPIYHIQIAGSAKTGYSYYQDKEFIEGESDLDIAIIDLSLFLRYTEIVYKVSEGLRKREAFPNKNGKNVYNYYCENIAKGMFRPDLMPICEEKKAWNKFFNKLTQQYFRRFKSINAGIYASQYMFEKKQELNFNYIKGSAE